MENTARLSDRFTVADFEPGPESIRRIADQGFRTVVNMKTAEEEQELSPEQEALLARDAGLDYLHYPVSGDALTEGVVDSFREKAPGLPPPILVHCSSGKRSGALVMMHLASERGMSGEDAIRGAETAGLNLGKPELREWVKSYVERHNGK